MFCRTHNNYFLSEQGCSKCRVSWEDGPWETKEKEWLNKLDEIHDKAQKLANHAAGLEVDNKSLKRSLNTATKNLSEERQSREKAENLARRHETKIKAIGLGYRNALEREEALRRQVEVVNEQRGEWIERCRRLEDPKEVSREALLNNLRRSGLMDPEAHNKRKVRGWVGHHPDHRSWEVHTQDCPVWLDGDKERCVCGGGQTNHNHPHVMEIITGYPHLPASTLEFHCRGCKVWTLNGGTCSCEHCVWCGEIEECICEVEGEHL
jgi:hypothetical protein